MTGNGIIGVTLSSSSSTFLLSNIKITWSHGYASDDEVGENERNVDNIDKDEIGWKKDNLLSFLSVFLTGRWESDHPPEFRADKRFIQKLKISMRLTSSSCYRLLGRKVPMQSFGARLIIPLDNLTSGAQSNLLDD